MRQIIVTASSCFLLFSSIHFTMMYILFGTRHILFGTRHILFGTRHILFGTRHVLFFSSKQGRVGQQETGGRMEGPWCANAIGFQFLRMKNKEKALTKTREEELELPISLHQLIKRLNSGHQKLLCCKNIISKS